MYADLTAELMDDLSKELSAADDNFNADILLAKVRSAIREVSQIRRYPDYYVESQIENDMARFYPGIRSIALYDYNMTGTEGQASHSENSVTESYVDRAKLFYGILPLARL